MAKPEYDNTNKGSLFKNHDKKKLANERDTSKWANAQGKINIYGIEFYLSAWTKIIKSGDRQGERFQSLSVKPVDEKQGERLHELINEKILMKGSPNGKSTPREELEKDLDKIDDDLPF